MNCSDILSLNPAAERLYCRKYGSISKLISILVEIDTRVVMITQSLIEAIADAKGKEPDDLEFVLEDHVSTDAIQGLDDHASESWTLQFELPNHTVQVGGDGTILVDHTQQQPFA